MSSRYESRKPWADMKEEWEEGYGEGCGSMRCSIDRRREKSGDLAFPAEAHPKERNRGTRLPHLDRPIREEDSLRILLINHLRPLLVVRVQPYEVIADLSRPGVS